VRYGTLDKNKTALENAVRAKRDAQELFARYVENAQV